MKTNKQTAEEIFKNHVNSLPKRLGKNVYNSYQRAAMSRLKVALAESGITTVRVHLTSNGKITTHTKHKEMVKLYANANGLTIPTGVNATSWLVHLYDEVDGLQVSRATKISQNEKPKPRFTKQENADFYVSREWRQIRYIALRNANGCCQCCGAKAGKGIVLHVDHIKPRSKYPELQLSIANLQVLCEDCNLGKSNLWEDDWRGKK